MKRAEYQEVKVQIFVDYDGYLADKYYDVSDAFIKINLRMNLYGLYNGLMIINDPDNIIENNGDTIFMITVNDPKLGRPVVFFMGSTHNDMTIMQNGDSVKMYNLVPYHNRKSNRFSKKLTNNSSESLEMMLDELYEHCDTIKPTIIENSVEAYVPGAIWVQSFDRYMEFIHEKGLSSENDQFVFCWYDESNINVMDYEKLISQDPIKGIIMEESFVGNLGYLVEDVPVFKYEFMTEANRAERSDAKNTTYVTTSNEKNGLYAEVYGTGTEMKMIDRSCVYREMTYSNGYEEINRSLVMSQYEGYSKFRTYGDMRLKPSVVMTIEDHKGLIKGLNIIDDVLYEFTQTESYTHVYLMTSNNPIEEVDVERVVGVRGSNYPYKYGESKSDNYDQTAEDFYKNLNKGGVDNYNEVYTGNEEEFTRE